jgi:putative transposase
MRQAWILRTDPLPLRRQCALAGVSRATYYAHQRPCRVDEEDLRILRLIDEEYTRHPFFGSRRMVQWLRDRGWVVNRKRVQRLMQQLGLASMAPGPHTSQPHPEHAVYPYLLRGVAITRPNQAWSTDITYIRLAQGFGYLVAIMDWYSRKVLTWRLSKYAGCGILRGRSPGGIAALWDPGDFQHRSRHPVHQPRLHRRFEGPFDSDQHGRARARGGQHFCRATDDFCLDDGVHHTGLTH